ncbi:hypothetical protein Tco_0015184 [Tanacetum coccineum]
MSGCARGSGVSRNEEGSYILKGEQRSRTIEESKDLTSLFLIRSLESSKVHEMIIKKDSEIVKAKGERKSLALKAKKESSDEECSTSGSEDEEYAMAVRDFKKFFKRRGRNVLDAATPYQTYWRMSKTAEKDKKPKEPLSEVCVRADCGDEDDVRTPALLLLPPISCTARPHPLLSCPVTRVRHKKEIDVIEYQVLTREIDPTFKDIKTILRENVFGLGGNRDHVLACLCLMIYCIANSLNFNLAYFMAKRMEWVSRQSNSIFLIVCFDQKFLTYYLNGKNPGNYKILPYVLFDRVMDLFPLPKCDKPKRDRATREKVRYLILQLPAFSEPFIYHTNDDDEDVDTQ